METVHWAILAVVVVLAGGALIAFYGGGYGPVPTDNQAPVGTNQVNIQNLAYSPANITVNSGSTVTWTNNDSVDHTVTSQAGENYSFDSGIISPDGTYQYTFDNVGTYSYYCTVHPYMTGTVIVQ